MRLMMNATNVGKDHQKQNLQEQVVSHLHLQSFCFSFLFGELQLQQKLFFSPKPPMCVSLNLQPWTPALAQYEKGTKRISHIKDQNRIAQKKTGNIISLISSSIKFMGKTTHAEQNPNFQMKNKSSILKKKCCCALLHNVSCRYLTIYSEVKENSKTSQKSRNCESK